MTQIAPSDQGVNVDVGNDGRGMSYSVSGSINLAYPGINTQDYTSWQFKDTMTFNVGNHTLKWGYEFIRPVFEFNLALTRSANFQGTRTGNADRGLHGRRVRELDHRVRHRRSQSEHGQAPGVHRGLDRMHPRLTVNYGLRYEPFMPFDQKGGRHTTWVPGVQSTVVPDAPTGILFPGDPGLPARLTNSDLNNFAPRLGAAWDVTATRRRWSAAATASSTSRSTARPRMRPRPPWRGTTQLRQGRIEDPFGSLGQTEPPPESPGAVRLLADRGVSRVCAARSILCRSALSTPIRTCARVTRTTSAGRSSGSSARISSVEAGYVGKIGSNLVGHNYFNAAPFINSPITGQPPTLQNVEQRVPFSPGIISAQSRVLGNFFRSEYHACS